MKPAPLTGLYRLQALHRMGVLERSALAQTREIETRVEVLGTQGHDRGALLDIKGSVAAFDLKDRLIGLGRTLQSLGVVAGRLDTSMRLPTFGAILGALRQASVSAVLELDPLSAKRKLELLQEIASEELTVVNSGTASEPRYNVVGIPFVATDFDGFDYARPTQDAMTADEAIHRAFAQLTDIEPLCQRATPKAYSRDEEWSSSARWYLFDHGTGAWRSENQPPPTMLTLG